MDTNTYNMSDKPVIVDPRGDLRLKVGSTDQTDEKFSNYIEFLVCSRALSRASPVFDRMLYGGFAEANHDDTVDWVVELKDDRPDPMQVFLNISHANFSIIPQVLSVDSLYDLAVLTHYFDVTPLLTPWIKGWMASIVEVARDANIIMPKMLWISWEFGLKEDFGMIARRMLMESKTTWSTETGQMEDIQTPPYIIERINALRLQTIAELLQKVRDMVEKLVVVDEGPRWCHHATWLGHHRCESMLLGSMTFCLARGGLWPIPEAADVELSLVDIYRVLTTLVIHDIGGADQTPGVDHRECNPRPVLLSQIQQIMGEIPSPLTDYHTSRLEEQAKKLQPKTHVSQSCE